MNPVTIRSSVPTSPLVRADTWPQINRFYKPVKPSVPTAHVGAWPYPRWVAHRGAGTLAPENTLAALRAGAAHGYRMFECDVKLSADGVPFLLHDTTLERTTNAKARLGEAQSMRGGDHPWHLLSRLDAGAWHSGAFAGEPIPTLESVARWCIANGFFLNTEIKPTPGTGYQTGEVVAHTVAQLWQGVAVPPLLTSFDVAALQGAKDAQPVLPRGLLLDELWDGWLERAQHLACQAIVCNYRLWNPQTVALAKSAGFKTLSYTVNDPDAVQRLTALDTDGIITDQVDVFSPL